MPIMARWRIPPENSNGYCLARSAGRVTSTRWRMSTASAAAAFLEIDLSRRRTASAIWSPMRIDGFRLVIGFWKIIATSWAVWIASGATSLPHTSTVPALRRVPTGRSEEIVEAVRLLPDPDSPASPTISPAPTVKLTSRTKGTLWPSLMSGSSTSMCRRSTLIPGGVWVLTIGPPW